MPLPMIMRNDRPLAASPPRLLQSAYVAKYKCCKVSVLQSTFVVKCIYSKVHMLQSAGVAK